MTGYDELPDDDYAAFIHLEAEFRAEFESKISESNANFDYVAADYMNLTLAAAKALNIEALSLYVVDQSRRDFFDHFAAFKRDVDNIIVQMRIHNSRRAKAMSVGLSAQQKVKIHAHIEKIRVEVENSAASIDKKEKLFKILASLAGEVSKARSGFERFGDLARGLAGISKDVEREGAQPWWKWFNLMLGVVDDAKEAEPQLPKPPATPKIEPPRKELPKPSSSEMDDEIPF